MDYSKIFAYEIPNNKLIYEEKVFLFRKMIPGPFRRTLGLIFFIPFFFVSACFFTFGWFVSWILTGKFNTFQDRVFSTEHGSPLGVRAARARDRNPNQILYYTTTYWLRGATALFLHDESSIRVHRWIKNGEMRHYKDRKFWRYGTWM